MKSRSIAFACGLALAVWMPGPASAQKIIHIGKTQPPAKPFAHTARKHDAHKGQRPKVRRYGKLDRHWRKTRLHRKKLARKRSRITFFALPEQTLFPPYYEAQRPWTQRPDMAGRIKGGRTVEGGSRYASHIEGGRTVEGGSRYRSRIKGGVTVEGGSRWASHIPPGRTVEGGSRWAGKMRNWTFSGYAAPVRPKGIPYFRGSWR